jgi:large subunit ribosomal protein L22
MAYKASYRFADISPTKVRSIATLIRGKRASDALDSLKFLPNRGARMLEKVVRSAMANAEEQGARSLETLKIVEARVDEGPRMKRIQPHARGMAFPILKRMCHIHVAVDNA